MDANPISFVVGKESHSMRLLLTLVDLGIIARGKFTWVQVRHDDGCPALASNSHLDCRCNPEVEIAGHCYLFSDFTAPGGRP